MSPDDGTVATPHERPPLLRGHFHTTFRVAAGEGFYCIYSMTGIKYTSQARQINRLCAQTIRSMPVDCTLRPEETFT